MTTVSSNVSIITITGISGMASMLSQRSAMWIRM